MVSWTPLSPSISQNGGRWTRSNSFGKSWQGQEVKRPRDQQTLVQKAAETDQLLTGPFKYFLCFQGEKKISKQKLTSERKFFSNFEYLDWSSWKGVESRGHTVNCFVFFFFFFFFFFIILSFGSRMYFFLPHSFSTISSFLRLLTICLSLLIMNEWMIGHSLWYTFLDLLLFRSEVKWTIRF